MIIPKNINEMQYNKYSPAENTLLLGSFCAME